MNINAARTVFMCALNTVLPAIKRFTLKMHAFSHTHPNHTSCLLKHAPFASRFWIGASIHSSISHEIISGARRRARSPTERSRTKTGVRTTARIQIGRCVCSELAVCVHAPAFAWKTKPQRVYVVRIVKINTRKHGPKINAWKNARRLSIKISPSSGRPCVRAFLESAGEIIWRDYRTLAALELFGYLGFRYAVCRCTFLCCAVGHKYASDVLLRTRTT